MKKIISVILIYCILIQIPLTHLGCKSFYPTEENKSLSNYNNYEGRILLKLKDNTELEVAHKYSVFITPDSGSGFWLVMENNKDEPRKIYDSDIEGIQVLKTNWVTTSLLIIGGVALVAVVGFFIIYSPPSLGHGSF